MDQDDILENIKRELKEEPNYDLSISELEVLSKCNYETIEQIFGKDFVARTPDEITINTICYIGILRITESLPTYNLKYIFGDLFIGTDNINLENLKFVSRNIDMSSWIMYDKLGLDELLDNKAYILYAVKYNANALEYAKDELKFDKKFVLEAVKQNGKALKYVEFDFIHDKDVVLEAVKQDGLVLLYASVEFKNDKDIVLEAVKSNGYALRYASRDLRNDKEVVLEAAREEGLAFSSASDELKNDKKYVLEVVKENGIALESASEMLKKDREVVLEAVRQNGYALQYASSEFKNDKEVVLEAVKEEGYALAFASDELKDDEEIALEAIKQNFEAVRWVSKRIMSKRNIVLKAVQNGAIPCYLPEIFCDDDEIMFESIKNLATLLKKHYISLVINDKRPFSQYYDTVIQSGLAHWGLNMSEKYTSNRESMLEMVKQCGWAYVLVSDDLKNDSEIIYEAIKQDESIKDYLNWTNVDWKSLIQEQNNNNISFKK